MFQLITDMLTNRITGYNAKVPSDTADLIILEDSQLEKIRNLSPNSNLYYIDGEIVEREVDEYTKESREIETEYIKANKSVANEHKTFMDNILNGMDITEASNIAKQNREKLEQIKMNRENFGKKYKEDLSRVIADKFAKEEESIDYKYYLSMLAIIRDENEYLVEWINWYLDLGFEHFYIYDNESATPIKEYLESICFKHMDKLTIMDWKTSAISQQDAYNDFLEKYRNETKWIMVTDPDELLYIKDDSKTLVEFLKENENYSSIQSLWQHYNANGQETKTEGTQFERFTQTTDFMFETLGGKCVAQTNRIKRFSGFTPVIRLNGKKMEVTDERAQNFFQLNHYASRSYAEWLEKMNRGTVLPYSTRRYSDFFKMNPDMEYLNTGEDYVQTYGSPKNENEFVSEVVVSEDSSDDKNE